MKLFQITTLILVIVSSSCIQKDPINMKMTDSDNYLSNIKDELVKTSIDKRPLNIVFHGHSVTFGVYEWPVIRTFESYPHYFHKRLKSHYPYGAVNIILTGRDGENSWSGLNRFNEPLSHNPDVLILDYALNDLTLGVNKSRMNWEDMIQRALKKKVKVILFTPTLNMEVEMSDTSNLLNQIRHSIIDLSQIYGVGLVDNYSSFEQLYQQNQLDKYMVTFNHPNEKGHDIIANNLLKWFICE